MRSLMILAALLTTVIFGTPVVQADPPRHQHRHYQHHHHGHHFHGYSYPSVARYSGGWNGGYARPFYGDHPYYHGVSVAGPIHPLYGPGHYQPYGYGGWIAPYSYGGFPGSLRITIGGPRFGITIYP